MIILLTRDEHSLVMSEDEYALVGEAEVVVDDHLARDDVCLAGGLVGVARPFALHRDRLAKQLPSQGPFIN